jgi:hypothetical protein
MAERVPLSALLSRMLVAFTIELDSVTVAELTRRARATPHLAGMRRWGCVTVAPDPADARSKPPERDLVVRPTTAGRAAQAVWCPLPSELEQRWRARFGARPIDELRRRLETIADASDDGRSRLFEGLAPAPDNWRSRTRPPNVLPDHPMPRQGGHPDGA